MKILLKRKNCLAVGISLFSALFVMLVAYVNFLPTQEFVIDISSSGSKNSASNATEFRINYILLDDEKFLTLGGYATPEWQYQGSLVTWSAAKLTVKTPPVRRSVEISFRASEWSGQGSLSISNEITPLDLYVPSENQQHIERIQVNGFMSALNVCIGIFSFAIIFFLLYVFIIKKRLYTHAYWNDPVNLSDFLIITCIAICVLFMMDIVSFGSIGSKYWETCYDIGGFITAGKLVAEGMIPYSQVFDHKGPLMFFFNALGCKIWYPYGPWLLETFLQLVGFSFCYFALKTRFNKMISCFATILTVFVCWKLMYIGNYTESWAMPFAFMGLYVFMRAIKHDCSVNRVWIVLFGMGFAVVFFLRQNGIALWGGAIPIIMVFQIYKKRFSELWFQIVWFIVGIAVVCIPVFIYLIATNSFSEFIKVFFLFNIEYASLNDTGIASRFQTLMELIRNTNSKYFIWALAVAVVYGCARVIDYVNTEKRNDTAGFELKLYLLFLVGLFISALFVTATSLPFAHYLLIAAPFFAITIAYVFAFLMDLSEIMGLQKKRLDLVAITLIFVLISSHFCKNFINEAMIDRTLFPPSAMQFIGLSDYMVADSSPDDTYAIYGITAIPNMFSDPPKALKPFTVYTPYALYWPTPESKIISGYLNGYMENIALMKPKFFVSMDGNFQPQLMGYINDNHYEPVEYFKNGENYMLYKRIN
jgi:hypothetical protein